MTMRTHVLSVCLLCTAVLLSACGDKAQDGKSDDAARSTAADRSSATDTADSQPAAARTNANARTRRVRHNDCMLITEDEVAQAFSGRARATELSGVSSQLGLGCAVPIEVGGKTTMHLKLQSVNRGQVEFELEVVKAHSPAEIVAIKLGVEAYLINSGDMLQRVMIIDAQDRAVVFALGLQDVDTMMRAGQGEEGLVTPVTSVEGLKWLAGRALERLAKLDDAR